MFFINDSPEGYTNFRSSSTPSLNEAKPYFNWFRSRRYFSDMMMINHFPLCITNTWGGYNVHQGWRVKILLRHTTRDKVTIMATSLPRAPTPFHYQCTCTQFNTLQYLSHACGSETKCCVCRRSTSVGQASLQKRLVTWSIHYIRTIALLMDVPSLWVSMKGKFYSCNVSIILFYFSSLSLSLTFLLLRAVS